MNSIYLACILLIDHYSLFINSKNIFLGNYYVPGTHHCQCSQKQTGLCTHGTYKGNNQSINKKTTRKLNTCTAIEGNVEEKQTYTIGRVIKKGFLIIISYIIKG